MSTTNAISIPLNPDPSPAANMNTVPPVAAGKRSTPSCPEATNPDVAIEPTRSPPENRSAWTFTDPGADGLLGTPDDVRTTAEIRIQVVRHGAPLTLTITILGVSDDELTTNLHTVE